MKSKTRVFVNGKEVKIKKVVGKKVTLLNPPPKKAKVIIMVKP